MTDSPIPSPASVLADLKALVLDLTSPGLTMVYPGGLDAGTVLESVEKRLVAILPRLQALFAQQETAQVEQSPEEPRLRLLTILNRYGCFPAAWTTQNGHAFVEELLAWRHTIRTPLPQTPQAAWVSDGMRLMAGRLLEAERRAEAAAAHLVVCKQERDRHAANALNNHAALRRERKQLAGIEAEREAADARATHAEAQLHAVDQVLDRRDALSHVANRVDKILLAIKLASVVDPKGELARLHAALHAAEAERDALRTQLERFVDYGVLLPKQP